MMELNPTASNPDRNYTWTPTISLLQTDSSLDPKERKELALDQEEAPVEEEEVSPEVEAALVVEEAAALAEVAAALAEEAAASATEVAAALATEVDRHSEEVITSEAEHKYFIKYF